mgnify:CR=1 FL=1
MSNRVPQQSTDPANRFDESLLHVLRCPVTKSRLRLQDDWLISEIGGLAYPIRDGIPVMLPESARLPAGVVSLEDFRDRFVPAAGTAAEDPESRTIDSRNG